MDKEQFSALLKKVINHQDLSRDETFLAFKTLLDHSLGESNETTFGAFLSALQTKGPTKDEILGLIDVVLNYDRKEVPFKGDAKDLCGIVGSGKDDLKTFNVSTAAAILASCAGVKTVKNGSRSDTSKSGTTDVLEELGVNIHMDSGKMVLALEELNLTFCEAESHFPRMAKEYVGKVLFINPLSYILSIASGLTFKKIVFGISFDDTDLVADLLEGLGYEHYMVVAGKDTLGKTIDEISNIGPTKITQKLQGVRNTYTITPQALGLKLSNYDSIKQGLNTKENAEKLMAVLNNKANFGMSDIVAMNAGALIYLSGVMDSLENGITLAKKHLENGDAYRKFVDFKNFSNKLI